MPFSTQDSVFFSLFVFVGGWLSICLHESAHGIVVFWGRDPSVKGKGALGLNLFEYSDPYISLSLPLIFWLLGGFPLPGSLLFLSSHLLRNRVWRSGAAAAGPAMSGVLAIAFSLPFLLGFPLDLPSWLGSGLALLAEWAVVVTLVSLLPIPGLDGYSILEPWLPKAIQRRSQRLKTVGLACLLGVMAIYVSTYSWVEYNTTFSSLLSVPEQAINQGVRQFDSIRMFIPLVSLVLLIGYFQRTKARKEAMPSKERLVKEAYQLIAQRKANQAQLQKEPDHYGALVDQGKVLMKQRAYAQAVEHYSQALEHYPKNANFWHQRGFAKARQQQFAAALSDYDQSLEYRPNYYRTLHVKADALLMLERNGEAVDTFDQVLRYQPSDAHLWYDRGQILERLGQKTEALKSYQKALKLDPKKDAHWARVVLTHHKLGQQEQGDRRLAKGLKLHPQSRSLWLIKLAQAYEAADHHSLLKLCEQCESCLKPEPLTAFYKAWALTQVCRYSKAKAIYDQTLDEDPSATWLLLHRAFLCHEMYCFEQALADIEELLAEEPDDLYHQECKALFLIGAKRYQDALAIYSECLGKADLDDVDRIRLFTGKGYTLRKLEDYEAALAEYEQALALQPEYSHALGKRGELHGILGQQDLALADLDRAIKLDTTSPALWRTRIHSLYAMGLYVPALESCEQAHALKPSISLWIEKARCHLALQDIAQAKEALTSAQALDASTTDRIVAEKPTLAELWQEHFVIRCA